jgi:DNA-binding beta-propeller fold protein YncE
VGSAKFVREGFAEAEAGYSFNDIAFVPGHDRAVATAYHQVRLLNIKTGVTLSCMMGPQRNTPYGEGRSGRGSGEGEFSGPHGVAVNSELLVFVAEGSNRRVSVLSIMIDDAGAPQLVFLRFIGEGKLGLPHSLALGCSSNFFVSDGASPGTVGAAGCENGATDCIYEFNIDGTFVKRINVESSGTPGYYSDGEETTCKRIMEIAALPGGGVAVVERITNRISMFSAEGHFVRAFGGNEVYAGVNYAGWGNGEFFEGSAVASDTFGNLLVMDGTSRLQVFDPEGVFLYVLETNKDRSSERFQQVKNAPNFHFDWRIPTKELRGTCGSSKEGHQLDVPSGD